MGVDRVGKTGTECKERPQSRAPRRIGDGGVIQHDGEGHTGDLVNGFEQRDHREGCNVSGVGDVITSWLTQGCWPAP